MNLDALDHPLAARAVDLAGQDVPIGPTTFRIRALGSRNIDLMIFMADVGLKTLGLREALPHLPKLLASAAVVGWHDLKAGGEEVPYSYNTALELFSKHPLLAQEVFFAAINLSADGREEAALVEVKKSQSGGGNGVVKSSISKERAVPVSA